jgi:lipopolysaccharide/colanic/teichoic acid biosynthesis glycosyltransferase
MQRLLDILFSSIAITVLAPILLFIALILRFTGEKEVFFKQQRIGQHGQVFEIVKFATMLKDSPNMSLGTITIENDPRILPIGSFLRRSKINELPQLINILKGDMSIVGPRPQTERCFKAFPVYAQKKITKVRPGLTGTGSIFFRNEEQLLQDAKNADAKYNDEIMPFKGKLEVWYVENNSLIVYFAIIFSTLSAVLIDKPLFENSLFRTLPKRPEQLLK